MILDKQMELADRQSISATAKSLTAIDLGPNTWAGNSVGTESDLGLLITVDEDAAGGGSIVFQVRSADNSAMNNAVIHTQSGVLRAADLKVGKIVPFHPQIPYDADQFVDIRWVVDGELSGSISIHGLATRQTNR